MSLAPLSPLFLAPLDPLLFILRNGTLENPDCCYFTHATPFADCVANNGHCRGAHSFIS